MYNYCGYLAPLGSQAGSWHVATPSYAIANARSVKTSQSFSKINCTTVIRKPLLLLPDRGDFNVELELRRVVDSTLLKCYVVVWTNLWMNCNISWCYCPLGVGVPENMARLWTNLMNASCRKTEFARCLSRILKIGCKVISRRVIVLIWPLHYLGSYNFINQINEEILDEINN